MSARLPTGIVATALIRRVGQSGGFATVLARGGDQAGAILLLLRARDGTMRALERGIGGDGRTALIDSTPKDSIEDYWRRRRSRDPDLWVIELDTPDAERFAAETIADG